MTTNEAINVLATASNYRDTICGVAIRADTVNSTITVSRPGADTVTLGVPDAATLLQAVRYLLSRRLDWEERRRVEYAADVHRRAVEARLQLLGSPR